MRPSKTRIALAVTVASLTCWTACTVFDDAVLPDARADAAPDVVTSADAAPDVEICPHTRIPAPPALRDASADDAFTVIIAVQPSSKDAGTVGFDLDGVCTGQGEPAACAAPDGGPDPVDDPGGVDNKLQQLAGLVGDSLEVADSFKTGALGLLFRIEGYNGLPDDDAVQVSAYRSAGLDANDGGPTQTRRDEWIIDSKDVVGPDFAPRRPKATGYVSGSILVASFGNAGVPIGLSEFSVNDAQIVGRLNADRGEWALDDAVLAGRWNGSDLLFAVGILKKPPSNALICEDVDFMEALRTVICGSVDVAESRSKDGLGLRCTYVSMASAFFGAPASFYKTTFAVPPFDTSRCVDAGTSTFRCE